MVGHWWLRVRAIGVAAVVGAVVVLPVTIYAATSINTNVEPELAAKVNVTTINDTSASGGAAVKFGDTPAVGVCPSATPNKPDGLDPWGGCWPGPATTGYPHGLTGDTRTPVVLTAYTGPTQIRECGVVIDSKIVNSDILIEVGNGTTSKDTPCVTIKNSLINGVVFSEQSNWGPVLITDTEVHPSGISWWENVGRSNVFAYRVNSHGSEGVIKCDQNCEAKDNYVHGMRLGGEYHYNAFGGNGTQDFLIEHNWASCGDWESIDPAYGLDAGCSAAIGFYGDFGPIQRVKIHRNYIAGTYPNDMDRGAGYCLNPGFYPGKPYPAPDYMTVTDNIFARGSSGKCGAFGPTNAIAQCGQMLNNIWSGNRFEDDVAIPFSCE